MKGDYIIQTVISILFLVGIILLIVLYYKHCKKFKFDSVVMVNGAVGSGKTSTTLTFAINSHKFAHKIWWRRVHIWSIFNPKFKSEEEPLLYSNIPLEYKYYVPLTTKILKREERPNFKSVIFISESSLVANSMDYKDKILNEQLTLFLKLVRHELHGSYRNIFGRGYANLYIETQSKNDNHYAFDRCISQVLYLTKSINLPFFKIVWCRELLLIDSVQNDFEDDFKEDISNRWYILPKKIFKRYDSYCYKFLTDDLPVNNTICHISLKEIKSFEIPSFHTYYTINQEKESDSIGQQEMV